MRVKAAKLDRKAYTLLDFRGVDYSSSPLEVKPYRATDMANLLLKDGVLHKRKGWEQIMKMPYQSKDMYLYDGSLIVRCLHGEKSIYYSVDIENKTVERLCDTNGVAEHTSFFEYKHILYVADGTYFKIYREESENEEKGVLNAGMLDKDFGEWKQKKNEDGTLSTEYEIDPQAAYVPLTTVNIVSLEASSAIISAYERTKNDSLNLLSLWRRNLLIYENPITVRRYKLDGIPYESSIKDRESENGLHKKYYPILTMKKGDETKQYIFSMKAGENFWSCDVNSYYNQNGTAQSTVIKLIIGKYSTLETAGKIKAENVEDETEISSGTNRDIGFFIMPINFRPWKKESTWAYEDVEMTITYVSQDDIVKGETQDDIDTTKTFTYNAPNIGILHGVSGANDRLFLAGGAEESRNLIFYTENEDLTYFPANQQLSCGDTRSAISAVERLADGCLAVFKAVDSLRETSVYYITGKTVSLGIGEEGNEYYADNFSVSSGAISKRGVSARSTINYDGDSLFASKDGVYAIVLSDSIYTTERYTRERSRPIASRLQSHDLSNAAAIVFDDMYWLAIADGTNEVYVANAKYKYSTEGTENNSYNFEWFRLTDIPAVSFLEKSDDLYFLTLDGWICKFYDGYADIYSVLNDSGELTVTNLTGLKIAVAFDSDLLDLVKSAAYAVDENGVRWEIRNVRVEEIDGVAVNVFDVPDYANVEMGALGLRFYVPVKAYWKSAILDLGSPIHRKNLWGISMSVMPTSNGSINLGYKTRRENQLEGINAFNFGEVDFAAFSFDCGGFVNTFRQRIFERGLMYMQMMYSSELAGDCVVNSITIEYAMTSKNIGIG